MATQWHWRGTPPFLADQAVRLGSTQILADRARHIPEIYRISVLMAQLCERYHRAKKQNGAAVFEGLERKAILDVLNNAEKELQKLYMAAGAAVAMMAEAYDAFDADPPDRPFELLAAADDARAPTHEPPIESEAPCLTQP